MNIPFSWKIFLILATVQKDTTLGKMFGMLTSERSHFPILLVLLHFEHTKLYCSLPKCSRSAVAL